jgi:gluconate 2-dehydrogenase gamma chain
MENNSRRRFLFRSATGLGGAWLSLHWPAILAAQNHAREAANSPPGLVFQFFSPGQAAEVEAAAAQIIPADDTPGAREARVVYFIDRALVTFDKDKQPAYLQGIRELQAKTRKLFSQAKSFAGLTSAQQIEVLHAIEKTAFFELLRLHTIVGFFARPEYGGNHNHVGWQLIGLEDEMTYEPPFGYYDAEYNKRQ